MHSKDGAPRPSATVVLVRPGPGAPEILMVKRHARTAFGSAYAFPGGVLEPADRRVGDRCRDLGDAEASRILDLPAGGLAYYSAAIRELFEETGVLLAAPDPGPERCAAARAALNAGRLGWDRFVADAELELCCGDLSYIGFWITPEGEPKRFSARFFLARLPDGQAAAHCGGEITDSCWMPAAEILAARAQGAMRLIYPTRKTLETLATFDAVDPMLAWARECAASGRVVCDRPTRAEAGLG
ncbi:MAG: NUDIX hydrolase [Woeseiaceae bacterium]|nr:NUDIX hydrolase [Woeseiaceae bacterium]